MSWGSAEAEFDASTLNSVNVEFQKLAAMGFTVIVASGDDGTGHSGLFKCGQFQPTFPATSPYVTAVGGTILNPDLSESGWSDSGGGFSATFPRPSFQASAAGAYLNQPNLPSTSVFNTTGRGIPDVSALSTNYQIVISGAWGPLSGTSAATPTFAAMISLINGARKADGKPPLGFLSPALYASGAAFTDITQGNNKSPPCPTGFPATAGWDAITGLGTPKFQALLAALSS